MTRRRCWIVVGCIAASLVLAAPTARADERAGAADKAMAEALFRAAKDLGAKGLFAEACPKFAESHRLDPKPGTILNLASCHEQEGKTATAWAEYGEALIFAQRSKQAEREKFAKGKVDELEKKLSWITFKFPDAPNLDVQLDGKSLKSAAAGSRVPLDPGEHLMSAKAEKKVPWSGTLVVAEGPSERTFEVPVLEDEVPSAESAAPAPPSHEPSASTRGATQRVLGWIGVGTGAVALGFGAFFGAQTFGERSTIDDNCQGAICNRVGYDANDRAKSDALISTVGFVAGAVLVATGIVLLVTAPPRTQPIRSPAGQTGLFRATW